MPNKLTHWKLSCQDIFSSWSRKHRFTVYAWWDKFSVYSWAVSSTWNDYGLKGMTVVLDISRNNMSLWCAAFHLELKKEQSWQVQWNTIIKCQWAGEICLLYRVFVISKPQFDKFSGEQPKCLLYCSILYWFSMPSFYRSEQLLLPITAINIFSLLIVYHTKLLS